jgi:fructose-1,6-bisphosphatase/inositol monophosphatase family enzyme
MTVSLKEPVADLIRAVAAEVILPRFQNLAAHEVMEKAADDLVTVADRESEARLI